MVCTLNLTEQSFSNLNLLFILDFNMILQSAPKLYVLDHC